MPIKFFVLGGGGSCFFFGNGGGVEVPILFLWAWGFFRQFWLERSVQLGARKELLFWIAQRAADVFFS